MIEIARSGDPATRDLLARHPHVGRVERGQTPGIDFERGGKRRSVRVGDPRADVFGLMELMDNNPVVCAETVSVPSASATLALIAVGPIAVAGLVAESPALALNLPANEKDLDSFFGSVRWEGGVTVHEEPYDLVGVGTMTAMVPVWTPERAEDVRDLYDERFGRSFFVARDEESPWDPAVVRSTPYARYRMSLALDEPHSLLTVRVLADLHGKLGAAQAVHALNIMCGFEESSGIL